MFTILVIAILNVILAVMWNSMKPLIAAALCILDASLVGHASVSLVFIPVVTNMIVTILCAIAVFRRPQKQVRKHHHRNTRWANV